VSDQNPAPAERPVDPLFSHAASPFMRTEPPTASLAFPSPSLPDDEPMAAVSTWSAYKTQIQYGFAILAYLMVLVGAVTVVQANSQAVWRFIVALLPVVPAGLVVALVVRSLARLDEVQKRTQMQALGFSMAATGLLTFGYGFLEGVGMPHLSPTFVLPTMAILWGTGVLALMLRYRFRR
jgi:hypothetical protein